MNESEAPYIQIPRRCQDCDKTYSRNGIGADILADCPGGLCLSCGKPALVDFAHEYLSHPKQSFPAKGSADSMYKDRT